MGFLPKKDDFYLFTSKVYSTFVLVTITYL